MRAPPPSRGIFAPFGGPCLLCVKYERIVRTVPYYDHIGSTMNINDIARKAGVSRATVSRYLNDGYVSQEKRLLKAAHYLATQWEFNILYQLCPFIRGIEQIKQEIEDQLEDHINLIGVQKISLKRKTYGFIDLCGQLPRSTASSSSRPSSRPGIGAPSGASLFPPWCWGSRYGA